MSGHDYPQGRRAAMIATAAKLRALTADLEALATGHLADAALLADAPILDHWELAQRSEPCLIGIQSGHPLFSPNTAIYTSGLYFLDPKAGIARTLSRWYRLGRERGAGGGGIVIEKGRPRPSSSEFHCESLVRFTTLGGQANGR